MRRHWKSIVISVVILSISAFIGNLLRGVQISIETYRNFAGHPLFIIISIIPFIGCLVFGFIIARKYYEQKEVK
jgi:ABC-type sugar transport system permease subunit